MPFHPAPHEHLKFGEKRSVELLYSATLPETNELHLRIHGWKTILSFWDPAYFQVRTVSFRGVYNIFSKCDF